MGMNIGEILTNVQKPQVKNTQEFKVGSIINVFFKIIEGKRERLQTFTGTVLSIKGSGLQKMVKVRKLVGQIGVERTFPLHSPVVQKIEFVKQGHVRRAKLFYLRDRIGKKAQLKVVRTAKKEN